MGEEADTEERSLLPNQNQPSPEEEESLKRTGTVWTAVSHIITGLIGSGVLSLAWSVAQLGWIAGPLAMLCFAFITLLSTYLLCDCYRSPDPEFGPARNPSFVSAVDASLGTRAARFSGIFVEVYLYGTGIAYTITSAISMRAIEKSNCYHKEGHEASCEYPDTFYILIFGAIQIIMSQIPDFHNMHWLSIFAAAMSFAYSFIGFGLGLATVIENGFVMGSITGVSASSGWDKLWNISQALGDIAFAYPFSIIFLEIQDTLKSPPSENTTMKKATTIAMVVTTSFYLLCGGFGYAAFGDATPGNLLTGFGFYEPYWLIDFANACIALHLVGGYQVYSQPVFATVETWLNDKYPNNWFINNNFNLKLLPWLPAFKLNSFRMCFRTLYVLSTTIISIVFPYFNQVLGLLGALNFWPLTIYFPVQMYFRQRNIEAWSFTWIVLQAFSVVLFFIAAFALVGSIEGLVSAKLS